MSTILDGKKVAEAAYAKMLLDLSLLPVIPKMTVILVGEDPASQTYVRSKTKKCQDLGIRSDTITLPATVSEEDLLAHVDRLNRDKDTHGILIQLPLPAHITRTRVLRAIHPLKDVDGLHPDNAGRLMQGDPVLVPCTPAGVIEILKFYSIPIEGQRAVVLGRSDIVGKPVAQLLLMNNATVTVCHSKTKNLKEETQRADILVAAIGQRRFVTADMVRSGAVVIDVGIHRTETGLCGDVDFAAVSPKVAGITPVPGGVGPMTIAMLMKNLIAAARLQK